MMLMAQDCIIFHFPSVPKWLAIAYGKMTTADKNKQTNKKTSPLKKPKTKHTNNKGQFATGSEAAIKFSLSLRRPKITNDWG